MPDHRVSWLSKSNKNKLDEDIDTIGVNSFPFWVNGISENPISWINA